MIWSTFLKPAPGGCGYNIFEQVWSEWRALVPQTDQSDAGVIRRLRQALHEAAPNTYQESYEELVRLKNLEPDLVMRRKLLGRLEQTAPAWASAIQNRHPRHSMPEPPGEPAGRLGLETNA